MYEFDYNNTIPSYEKLLTDENSMEYGVNKEIDEIITDIKNLEERLKEIRSNWRAQILDKKATWETTVEMVEEMEKIIEDVFYDIIERFE